MMAALVIAAAMSDATCLNTGTSTTLTATIVGRINDNPGGHAPFPYAAARLDRPICVADSRAGKRLTVNELVIEPSLTGPMANPLSMSGRKVRIAGTIMLERHRAGDTPTPSLRNALLP